MKSAAALAVLLLWQSAAFADVVTSKSGQTLEGTITRENENEVALDVDGMELTLKRAEIESIRRAALPKKKRIPPKVLEAAVEKSASTAPAEPAGPANEAPPPGTGPDLSKLERPVIVFDKRDWKRVTQEVKNNIVVAQFLPDGERLQDWNELVTAQLYIGLRTEPRYYAKYVQETAVATCPGTQWQIVRETPYDVMYEWGVKGCDKAPDQSRIGRVILGTDGLHILEYAIKLGEMPADDREKWIGCLEASQIVKPQA